jgi:hypothetical protein
MFTEALLAQPPQDQQKTEPAKKEGKEKTGKPAGPKAKKKAAKKEKPGKPAGPEAKRKPDDGTGLL